MAGKHKKIIENYLQSDIPYALLLEGDWGSGKTWYIKNQFASDFGKKPIYTSAHGIDSVDELTNQIILQKYHIKRKGRLWGVANAVGKIIRRIAGGISEKMTNVNVSNLLDLRDILRFTSIRKDEVIIIDDLERMREVKIKDLLAFVSTNFTEQNVAKVILVTNKAKLLKDKTEEEYREIAEKTIWQTVTFEPEYDQTIPKLLKENLIGFSSISDKYPDIEKDILYFLKRCGINNFRTILFSLDVLNRILIKPDKYELHELQVLVNVVFILSNEYKEGTYGINQESEIPEYIRQPNPVLLFDPGKKAETKSEKIPDNLFYDRYIRGKNELYFYFESIAKFIQQGYFDEVHFNQELDSFNYQYKPTDSVQLAPHKIYNFRDMEDEELKKVETDLFKGLEDGKYDILTVANLIQNLPYLYALNLMGTGFNKFNTNVVDYIENAAIYKDVNFSLGYKKDDYLNIDESKYDNVESIKTTLEAKLTEKERKLARIRIDSQIDRIVNMEKLNFHIGDFIKELEIEHMNNLSKKMAELKNKEIHSILQKVERSISESTPLPDKITEFLNLLGNDVSSKIGKAMIIEFKRSYSKKN